VENLSIKYITISFSVKFEKFSRIFERSNQQLINKLILISKNAEPVDVIIYLDLANLETMLKIFFSINIEYDEKMEDLIVEKINKTFGVY